MEKYLITGATGLIGSALVRRLATGDVDIDCPIRSAEKVHKMFETQKVKGVRWTVSSLEDYLDNVSERFDYIIHCASPTASKYFVDHPVETMRFNIDTTISILDYARAHKVKGVVYLSSLESYGTILDDTFPVTEDVQGYVNPMECRSSYNIAKRTCESLCHAYAEEYNVPVKVVRLTQTISPYINDSDMRVFAQFARHAAKGENIELHTEGTAARQYIHIDDAVEAILCVLHKGIAGEVYNAAREDSYISIRDMSEFVQNNFNPEHKVVIQKRGDMGYAPVTKIRLNTQKLRDLGWTPKFGLYEMYDALIKELKK